MQKIIAKYPSEWKTQLEVEKVVANRIKLHVQANGTPQQKAKVEEFKEEEDRLQLLDAFLSAHKLVFFEWEQERIGKLTFLDSVPALAATPSVYHFHPVRFVEYLKESALPEMDVCPIDPKRRWIFVLHSTGGLMAKRDIQSIKNVWQGHKYIMKDGEVIEVWPFTEKKIRVTKRESRDKLIGQMFHVELNYGDTDKPTEEQYQVLADLYIEASIVEGGWPRIIPHIEIDRGIPAGHRDPVDFDYNHFYQILSAKGVPLDKIPHFDHDRYWGNYSKAKVPLADDLNSWPPRLSGDPHAKK